MIKFTIRDESGKVLRIGQCLECDYELQAQDGEYIERGHAPLPKEGVNAIYDLKAMRNALLKDTDWTQMPDSPLSDEMKNRYKQYRQALRDLPQNYGTINELSDVTFPTIEDF